MPARDSNPSPSAAQGVSLDPDTWVRTHRQTYDRMAADYRRRTEEHTDADEAERFVRLVRAHRHHRPLIADVGCGPGRDALLLRLAGARTVGIDLSRQMLQAAAELDSSPLAQADMRRLPCRSGCFDAIWCFAALGHLPPQSLGSVLGEYRRAVGRGWLYVVAREGRGPRLATWNGALPRYFNDPALPQLIDDLRRSGFALYEHDAWPAADGRRWLRVIARAV